MDPYKEKLQDAIRTRVESFSKSVRNASLVLMHIAREMYYDVTNVKTVEVPQEFLDNTFIHHLKVGAGEASWGNARVHALQESYTEYRFKVTQYRGDSRIYEYGAMKYPTNPKNHMFMDLERFMIRSVFALCPGLLRKAIWNIINSITDDCQHEQEMKIGDKKKSHSRKNEDSVIRAAIQEHCAVLGLPNPAEKVSELKRVKERCYIFFLRYFVFPNRELELKADMEQGVEERDES
jgi:hypothetical protein